MTKYKLRIAKPSDAKEIANLHYSIQEGTPGIFAMMGKPFLKRYYKIVLNDPNKVAICAENEKGQIVGFNNSTLDAKAQMNNLRKKKVLLAFAALTSILSNPKLNKLLLDRYKSMYTSSSIKYFISERVRGEFWVWKATEKDPVGSVEMHMAYRAVLRALGVKEIFYEVDASNKKVLAYHKLHKDVIIETINLPDGRKRYLMKSDLTQKNTK